MADLFAKIKPPFPLRAQFSTSISSDGTKVQSDYLENSPSAPSYIQNRPFYAIENTAPLELSFDGSLGGKHTIVVTQTFILVKIYDKAISLDEFLQGEVEIYGKAGSSEESFVLSMQELDIDDSSSQGIPAVIAGDGAPLVALVYDDISFDGMFMQKGIYVALYEDSPETIFVRTLYFPSVVTEEIKKLDNKFLDAVWTASVSRRLANVFAEKTVTSYTEYALDSELPLLPLGVVVTYNGTQYSCPLVEIPLFGGGFIAGNLSLLDPALADTGEPFVLFVGLGSEGRFAIEYQEGITSADIALSIEYDAFEKLPVQFLPDGIGATPVTVQMDRSSKSSFDFYYELKEGWDKGNTVLLSASGIVGTPRLVYLNTGDPLGETWDCLFVGSGGDFYYISSASYNYSTNGYLEIFTLGYSGSVEYVNTEGKVLVGRNNGYLPVSLNSTLTENSTLPAQEGAVFTAIQGLQNTIGTLNQDLENRLNGGT